MWSTDSLWCSWLLSVIIFIYFFLHPLSNLPLFCYHILLSSFAYLQFVQESPFLTRDLLESCFPYALLRDAYNSVYRKPQVCTCAQSCVCVCVCVYMWCLCGEVGMSSLIMKTSSCGVCRISHNYVHAINIHTVIFFHPHAASVTKTPSWWWDSILVESNQLTVHCRNWQSILMTTLVFVK